MLSAKLTVGICLVTAVLAGGVDAYAHPDLEITGNVGARFGGSVKVNAPDGSAGETGKVTAPASLAYGATVGYRVQPNGFIALSYSRQQTELRYRVTGESVSASQDASIEYLQFGGYLHTERRHFFPYLGFSIGTTRFATLGKGGSDEWRFSGVLEGGVKWQAIEHLQFRLLMRMPITVLSGDSSVFCVSGSGCLISYDGPTLIQGEALAGISLTF
ncbi:MAG: outer membrane beta-barrel protein [Polyangiaceae bacterium]|nr:outer membrane beta-barrel protein [Polyangiaceae bacterium]